MSEDRKIVEYRPAEHVPVPFRPGLRALAAVAFAGAVYFLVFTVVISQKLQIPIVRMWTLYAAIALAVLGALLFRLAYRRATKRGRTPQAPNRPGTS